MPLLRTTFGRQIASRTSRAFSTTSSTMSMTPKPIKYYTFGTPNGHKTNTMFEELKEFYPGKFDYDVHEIDISKNTQKEDWFLKICPNGRIPAVQDPNNNDFNVFETAAILLYLEKKYDPEHKLSWGSDDPHGEDYRNEVLQWMFFVHGGIGPMQGQANHFRMQATGSNNHIPYALERYQNETRRLYSVLEDRLKNRDWLVGEGRGKYSLADINAFPWVWWHKFASIPDSDIGPNVQAWLDRNYARPAVQRSLRIPKETEMVKNILDKDWMPAKP